MTTVREFIASNLEGVHLVSWTGASIIVLTYFTYLIVYILTNAIYSIYFHPLRNISGPKLWICFPLLKNLEMIRGTMASKTVLLHEKYGEVVRVGRDELNFILPEAWKDIYGHGHAELTKSFVGGIGLPGSILTANAPDHFRLRRAMLPAFSDKALGQQEPLIRVYVDLLMEKLREVADKGEVADMVRWYNFTTFDLIADLAFGEELHGLAEGKSNFWIDSIQNFIKLVPVLLIARISPALMKVVTFFVGPKIRQSKKKHANYARSLAMKRLHRTEQSDRGDFMDYMLRSRGEKHELTEQELVANCDLLMIAGSETTATLLSGVTYWLLKTPDALTRVTEEVRFSFDKEEDITFREASTKLPYMLACLDEGLRIYPPVPNTLYRHTLPGAPTPIAGHLIPENMRVGIPQLATYHSERNFYQAKEFHPERWLPEIWNDPSSPFFNDKREARKPFSIGPRDCIGKNLAYHEMRLILARLLWNFDLELDEKSGSWHEQKVKALWGKRPLMVHLKRRIR